MKSEKDQEIFNLREQSQRLQVQLNNGHVGFSDFKEKKAKEVQELKNTIEAFSLKVWKQLYDNDKIILFILNRITFLIIKLLLILIYFLFQLLNLVTFSGL